MHENDMDANGIDENDMDANDIEEKGIDENDIDANGIDANDIDAKGINANHMDANDIDATSEANIIYIPPIPNILICPICQNEFDTEIAVSCHIDNCLANI